LLELDDDDVLGFDVAELLEPVPGAYAVVAGLSVEPEIANPRDPRWWLPLPRQPSTLHQQPEPCRAQHELPPRDQRTHETHSWLKPLVDYGHQSTPRRAALLPAALHAPASLTRRCLPALLARCQIERAPPLSRSLPY